MTMPQYMPQYAEKRPGGRMAEKVKDQDGGKVPSRAGVVSAHQIISPLMPRLDQKSALQEESMAMKIRSGQSSIIALDLLRGLAAFLVLLVHTRGAAFVEYGALPATQKTILVAVLFGLTRLGQEAVMAFFVLSGFLVGGQIIKRLLAAKFDLRHYAIDRCTRIFIPLVPACLFAALMGHLVSHAPIHPGVLVANMFGLNGVLAPTLDNDLPLRTLTYEIWFYIIGGAIGAFAAGHNPVFVFVVLCIATLVFSLLGAQFLLFWGLGAVTVLLLHAPYRPLIFIIGACVALSGCLLFELAWSSKSFVNVTIIPTVASKALICAGIAAMLPFLCSERVNQAIAFLKIPAGALGAMSYSLYLFHYPLNGALNKIFPHATEINLISVGYFGARIAICLLASTAFYFCFERNTGAIRRWLR